MCARANTSYADASVDLFAAAYLILGIMFCDAPHIVAYAQQHKALPPLPMVIAAANPNVDRASLAQFATLIGDVLKERRSVTRTTLYDMLTQGRWGEN